LLQPKTSRDEIKYPVCVIILPHSLKGVWNKALSPVALTPAKNKKLRISPRRLVKFEMAPIEYSGAEGKLIFEKKP
jgi:hypothetical protein